MSVKDIKKKIINTIEESDDKGLLAEISMLIDFRSGNNEVYKLSGGQLAALKESEEDIKNGNVYTDEEANDEIERWLKE